MSYGSERGRRECWPRLVAPISGKHQAENRRRHDPDCLNLKAVAQEVTRRDERCTRKYQTQRGIWRHAWLVQPGRRHVVRGQIVARLYVVSGDVSLPAPAEQT